MSTKSRLSFSQVKKLVKEYNSIKKNAKKVQDEFDSFKSDFNSKMEKYFQEVSSDSLGGFTNSQLIVDNLLVTRVQKTSVKFDADKVEKSLGKELSKKVINKKYEIYDIEGLIAYLKSCGVDPKMFKKFIITHKTVNSNELDKLSDLGKVGIDKLKGCYTVDRAKPYFLISERRDQGGEE